MADDGTTAPPAGVGIPDLKTLYQALEAAFPDCRVRVLQPMAAEPFAVVQNGAFSAVLIRPTEEGLRLKAGLPPNGIGVAFGMLGMAFQVRRRQALSTSVRSWASGTMGWRVLP